MLFNPKPMLSFRLVVIIFCFFVASSTHAENTGKVLLIRILDTADTQIGEAVRTGAIRTEWTVQSFKASEVRIVDFFHGQENSDCIWTALQAIDYSQYKAVWVYINCHGVNDKESIWPRLLFPGNRSLRVNEIYNYLKERVSEQEGNFLLVTADCCNSGSERNLNAEVRQLEAQSQVRSVLLSASSPHQAAYQSSLYGGIFTFFFASLFPPFWEEKVLKGENTAIAWRTFLDDFQTQVKNFATERGKNQQPIFKIN